VFVGQLGDALNGQGRASTHKDSLCIDERADCDAPYAYSKAQSREDDQPYAPEPHASVEERFALVVRCFHRAGGSCRALTPIPPIHIASSTSSPPGALLQMGMGSRRS
jgi:hypothetical protein